MSPSRISHIQRLIESHERIIAFVTDAEPIEMILSHIDEPTKPPEISPARSPPAWDESEIIQDIYEYNFDQSISW